MIWNGLQPAPGSVSRRSSWPKSLRFRFWWASSGFFERNNGAQAAPKKQISRASLLNSGSDVYMNILSTVYRKNFHLCISQKWYDNDGYIIYSIPKSNRDHPSSVGESMSWKKLERRDNCGLGAPHPAQQASKTSGWKPWNDCETGASGGDHEDVFFTEQFHGSPIGLDHCWRKTQKI